MPAARYTLVDRLTSVVRADVLDFDDGEEFTVATIEWLVGLHDWHCKSVATPLRSCACMLQRLRDEGKIEFISPGNYRRIFTREEAMSRRQSRKLKSKSKSVAPSAKVLPFPEAAQVAQPALEFVSPEGGPETNKTLTRAELIELLAAPVGTRRLRVLTPEMSALILSDHNKGNSRVQQSSVDAYAADMTNGAWEYTGDPITFDIEGNMTSGQHRCIASDKSGVSFLVDLVFGLPLSARSKRNTGKRDKPGDFLDIAGWKNASVAAQAVRWLIIYAKSIGGAPNRSTFAPSHYPTLAKMFDKESLDHCVKVGITIKKLGVQAPAQHIAAVYYNARLVDKKAADKFFEAIWAQGKTVPVLTDVTKKLAKMTNAAAGSNQSGTDWDKFVLLVLAWNNWRTPTVRTSDKALSWSTNQNVPGLI